MTDLQTRPLGALSNLRRINSSMMMASMLRLLGLLLGALLLAAGRTDAYRIFGSDDVDKPFRPYERGFVGVVVDPDIPVQPTVNPGYEAHSLATVDLPSDNRLRRCPGMIGPAEDDGKYYCTNRPNGYCDRRSGHCVCSKGYSGTSCTDCALTHHPVGGQCLPKKTCPNSCSSNGECDTFTGRCRCNEFREGDDCSILSCEKFHPECAGCNNGGCTSCREGWGVNEDAPAGKQCVSCAAAIDPRCIACNISTSTCLHCIDPLLASTRRSGAAHGSMPLPGDELRRNLSYSLPFGSQDPSYYDEAEVYFVVDQELTPLNASTVACDQGFDLDASVSCRPLPTSHVVCGNYGSIYFESPYYEVVEDAGFVRVSVLRSGGGVGTVSVQYHIEHLTTDNGDVTPTAFYTTSQVIEFGPGVIRKSFLVTLNDDRLLEEDECFSIILSVYAGPAQLGNQRRSTICIIDDDANRTCSLESEMIRTDAEAEVLTTIAGEPLAFSVQAKSCVGEPQQMGGDHFHAVATQRSARTDATVVDGGVGKYNAEVVLTTAGEYTLDVYQLVPGGLRADYYNDAFLNDNNLEKTRIDALVNHTWGPGAVSTSSTDYVSVRWTGVLMSDFTELYTLTFKVDDHMRFWIDDILLIDAWDDSATKADGLVAGEHGMVQGKPHEIGIEYRDLAGDAMIKFFWSSASTPLGIVPPSALFYMEPIKGSPFPLVCQSARTSALQSTASGPGLLSGVSGKSHSFVVVPRDEFGNLRSDDHDDELSGRDGFAGVATLVDNQGGGVGSEQVAIDFVFNRHDHTYEANFVATISGTWQVNITFSAECLLGGTDCEGGHIAGSPFMVQTSPDATFAQESYATGIHHGVAGVASTFYVHARDAHRNVCNNDDGTNDDWAVVLRDEASEDFVVGSVQHEEDGRYQASFVPKRAGKSSLSVTLNGVHIKGSPFDVLVAHGDLDGGASIVVSA